MKLALLGIDDEQLRIARLVAKSDRHEIVAACAAPEWESVLRPWFPQLQFSSHAEALLHDPQIDAVLVNSEPFDPTRAESLRKLAQTGVCLILTFPSTDYLLALEIEMIRADRAGTIITYLPGLETVPAVLANRDPNEESAVAGGQDLDPLAWEWEFPLDTGRDTIWIRLARDLFLAQHWLGRPLKRVSAMGVDARRDTHESAIRWCPMSLLARTEPGEIIRWSATAVPSNAPRGRLTVRRSGPAQVFDLGDPGGHDTTDTASVDRWEEEAHDDPGCLPRWEMACQALAAVDGVEVSLGRGKPVELRHGLVTEEDSFKGIMAASGCLLLLGCLATLFVVVLVQALELPLIYWSGWRYWPFLLIVPLLIFLALQFVGRFAFLAGGRRS